MDIAKEFKMNMIGSTLHFPDDVDKPFDFFSMRRTSVIADCNCFILLCTFANWPTRRKNQRVPNMVFFRQIFSRNPEFFCQLFDHRSHIQGSTANALCIVARQLTQDTHIH
ncbi:MAG TPA: hypothetical protein DDX04_06125 [Massilia sp.]|nr:hypothetical protein [Massilia sp.]